MKNTFGQSVAVTLFGESHGGEIGAVLDGIAPGIPVDTKEIDAWLARRRPRDNMSTARREGDPYRIVSGVKDGYTTGAPLAVMIPNSDTRSADYAVMSGVARPNHADYTAHCKYHGFEDARGGGHFSGRLTAPLVALGGIVAPALAARGMALGAHVLSLGGVCDRAFSLDPKTEFSQLKHADFPTLDADAGAHMRARVLEAREAGDSVGGVIECAITGVPAGVGEPWFDAVECRLSRALFAIPAVRGVEFGDGFAMAEMRGSEANDAFRYDGGRVMTATNHSGGVQGGITNGMPIVFRVAIKPTPTIAKEQNTIDFIKGENATLAARGRHDPAIVHRACPVVEAVAALVLADMLAMRYGTDWLRGE